MLTQAGWSAEAGPTPRSVFYSAAPSPAAKLPAKGIYPRGRTLAYMGYSGQPSRDLTNGFTVAGPVYGDQKRYLEQCFERKWPVVAQVGIRSSLNQPEPLSPPDLAERIRQQVAPLACHPEVAWWAVTPEELRPWKADEMSYLASVCQAIRAHDPEKRPLFLYNPNHRTASTLEPIARHVNVLAKGCYVNYAGRKRNRGWVRWSVEQELEAIKQAGRPEVVPLVMPELCQDPEPGEDHEIRNWVRHDVYLGLCSGARGVMIWSLFNRKETRRTWKLWYDAYAECGRELNLTPGLARIFLFGERRQDLRVRQIEGEARTALPLGGKAEPATTSSKERAARELDAPSWTAAEFACDTNRWLFLVNSANTPAVYEVEGWPDASQAEEVFQSRQLPLTQSAPLRLHLLPYGVTALKFSSK